MHKMIRTILASFRKAECPLWISGVFSDRTK